MTFSNSINWLLTVVALFATTAHAAPDVAQGEKKAAVCVSCHGINGNTSDPAVPSLAAQTPLYIYYQLLQFREGRRNNDLMNPFAAKLSDPDMKDIAAYFAAQKSAVSNLTTDPEKAARGQAVAASQHCGSCHLPNYAGQNHIPRLAGLPFEYLLAQLRGFKNGKRPDIDGTMASAAQTLSDADMVDLAGFLASLR
jgi:cytochrome c553